MKKVIIVKEKPADMVFLRDVNIEDTPIFAKDPRTGKLKGMVVHTDEGWTVKVGGHWGSSGTHATIEACLLEDAEYHEFFIED